MLMPLSYITWTFHDNTGELVDFTGEIEIGYLDYDENRLYSFIQSRGDKLKSSKAFIGDNDDLFNHSII